MVYSNSLKIDYAVICAKLVVDAKNSLKQTVTTKMNEIAAKAAAAAVVREEASGGGSAEKTRPAVELCDGESSKIPVPPPMPPISSVERTRRFSILLRYQHRNVSVSVSKTKRSYLYKML